MPESFPQLVKGVDYYIEDGRWVFTAVYLLRRGKCCETGCRHCPYRGEEIKANIERRTSNIEHRSKEPPI